MKFFDAKASSNKVLNKGKEPNEPHNLVEFNMVHDVNKDDGRPKFLYEVAEQLNSLRGFAKTREKRCKKDASAPDSADLHHNHQEGTPSMKKNTPMKTNILPQPSVTTPLEVDLDMVHDIQKDDGRPNSFADAAEQLNMLRSFATRGKRRKKYASAPDSADLHHNHQEGTPSMKKNTPMKTNILPQPSVNASLEVDSDMKFFDAEASSNQEMKVEEQNEPHNLVEFNMVHDIQKDDGRPNSFYEVAEQLNSLRDFRKKKGKCPKKDASALDSVDLHHNHQEGTPSMKKNTPMKTNLLPQPSVISTPLKVDSEVKIFDSEASSNQGMNKGKEQNEPLNLMEFNKGHAIRKDDERPNVDIIDIKCLKNWDANSVLEIAEQLNGLPDCADTKSRGKHDTHVEEDVIAIEAMNTKTVKKCSSKRSKLSNAKENNLESVEDCSGSSVLVVENSVGDNCCCCSDESVPSCCPENMLKREVLAGHVTYLQVVECISVEKASSLFSESESTPEEINQRIEMTTSRQAINEGNFLKDVSIVDNPGQNLELDQRSKLKVAQNVEGNVYSLEESDCQHTEVCEQKTAEIQSKMEDSNSSIQLGATKEDVSPVLVKEDHLPQPLQQSPERAPTNHWRRKFLIPDLNELPC